ncbi:MAG: HAMP domain-containing protein [Gammaproteobacteria bacterium]|nr:HAMP domain-containing protein [Gammaproteobacteria bacterium]
MRKPAISIRWQIAIVLGGMACLILGMALAAGLGMQRAAYYLQRADKSHTQLQLASRLSSEIYAYVVIRANTMMPGRSDPVLQDAERRIDDLLEEFDTVLRSEVALISADAERQREHDEFDRTAELREQTQALFDYPTVVALNGRPGGQFSGIKGMTSELVAHVKRHIEPVVARLVVDEKNEIAAVERGMADLRHMLLAIGVAIAVSCLLLTVFLVWHVQRILTSPISQMISATAALSAGRTRQDLDGFRHDELGLLARHLDRMVKRVEHHRTKLETLNQELEDRVADRTELLNQSNQRLQAIDESRKRFLANVSHELRTPLTAIIGETELALQDSDAIDPDMAQSLRCIGANAAYLRRRVQDLLLLARSEDGQLQLKLQPVDLVELVAEICAQARGLAEIEQVAIDVRVVGDAGTAWVLADRSWLGQCLLGLIDNAVKFSLLGDTVRVVLQRGDGIWCVEICDQGPGFDDPTLPDLFDRYYQTSGGRMRGGAGLGLAIAHWIVKQHDADIRIDNTAEGARVSIELKSLDES